MWELKGKASPKKTDPPTTSPAVRSADTARPAAASTGVDPAAKDDRFGQAPTRFGKTLRIKGEMTASEDVYVEGEVEGKVELGDSALLIGQRGKVRAEVKAHSILVLGHLEGKVQAIEKTEIRKTGSLLGSLVTSRIVTEDGAEFRGSIEISEPEKKEEAPPAAAAERRPAGRLHSRLRFAASGPARSAPTTSRSKRRSKPIRRTAGGGLREPIQRLAQRP